MNASSPSFVFSFANSGMTGTGTFCALPFASAGLYTPDGAVLGEGLEGAPELLAPKVGDAVVERVSEGGLPGELPPWQPLSSNETPNATAAMRTVRTVKEANERRGMTGSPAAVW
ncbi:hypothetical protein [Paenarthrobacter sp. 2TAF44]|uniref:hypothetical protein n=1 Tax=Paenarthrobacter sp. 2TAF44 TaxID=3233018 RepID=UPI003F9BF58E